MAGNQEGIFIVELSNIIQAYDKGNFLTLSAYLLMVAGSDKTNQLTEWSALAVSNHLGITRLKAQRAINDLIASGLISKLEDRSSPTKPRYQILRREGGNDLIFLPMTLVAPVGKEIPVLKRLYQTRNKNILLTFTLLYWYLDMNDFGGLPWNMLSLSKEADMHTVYENDSIRVKFGPTGSWKLNKDWFDQSEIMQSLSIFSGFQFENFCESFFEIRDMGLVEIFGAVFSEQPPEGDYLGVTMSSSTFADLIKHSKSNGATSWPKPSSQGSYIVLPRHIKSVYVGLLAEMTYKAKTNAVKHHETFRKSIVEDMYARISTAARYEATKARKVNF